MKKKKVFFILPTFNTGGVERVTLNIINSLNTELFDIYLIICSGSSKLLPYIEKYINIIELKNQNVRSSSFDIWKLLRKHNPEIVFTSFDHLSLLLLTMKIIGGFNYKTVVRLNTLVSNKLESNLRGCIYNLFFKNLINKSDYIIAQTIEMKKDVLSTYNLKDEKVIVIHNIVNTEQIKILSEEKLTIFDSNYINILSVGSLGEVKGYDLLIKSMVEVLKSNNRYRLYIVGNNRELYGDYKSYLSDLINKLNLEGYVFLLGGKSNPYPYMKNADVFVLSSRKEGFPNVVLEALSLGTPCVVTNCVDFSSIIEPNVNGIIIEKNNVRAITTGIINSKNIERFEFNVKNFDYNNWFSSF